MRAARRETSFAGGLGRASRGRRRRAVPLTGWIKWLPVLALPFSVLFLETWLNVQTRVCDYEIFEINRSTRELQRTLDALKVREAQLAAMDRIGVRAPDLGLVEPNPGQIQTVYFYAERDAVPSSPSPPYDLARVASGLHQWASSGRGVSRQGVATPCPAHDPR